MRKLVIVALTGSMALGGCANGSYAISGVGGAIDTAASILTIAQRDLSSACSLMYTYSGVDQGAAVAAATAAGVPAKVIADAQYAYKELVKVCTIPQVDVQRAVTKANAAIARINRAVQP